MTRKIIAIAAALAALHTPAAAQDVANWDQDQNGEITRAEFMKGFEEAGLFDSWNRNGDESISELELAEGLYGFWDRNEDGELSVAEWEDGVDLWIGETDVDLATSTWDTDGNGVISQFEFASAFQQTGLVSEFTNDEDGVFEEEELAETLFAAADNDDDDLISVDEDGFFSAAAEMLDDPLEADDSLIEAGEAFSQLPIPCGSGSDCQQTAANFCSTLGYGKPIDTLAVGGQLYVVRCNDELFN